MSVEKTQFFVGQKNKTLIVLLLILAISLVTIFVILEKEIFKKINHFSNIKENQMILPKKPILPTKSQTTTIKADRKVNQQVGETIATSQVVTPTKAVTKQVVDKVAPAVPHCQRTEHVLPQAIDLSDRPAGLTHVINPVHYFRVYGRTPTQIKQQTFACSPNIGKKYLYAISQSRMAFSYNPKRENNVCKLTNVKVGLRTQVTLPTWQADEHTPVSTSASAKRFLAGLAVHENGHCAIDLQYAQKLLSILQNFSTTNCANLATEVNQQVQNIQAELRRVQYNYEIRTNYGANQGAWL